MGLEHAEIYEIVEKAVAHKWGIPEFQRGFVWTKSSFTSGRVHSQKQVLPTSTSYWGSHFRS